MRLGLSMKEKSLEKFGEVGIVDEGKELGEVW